MFVPLVLFQTHFVVYLLVVVVSFGRFQTMIQEILHKRRFRVALRTVGTLIILLLLTICRRHESIFLHRRVAERGLRKFAQFFVLVDSELLLTRCLILYIDSRHIPPFTARFAGNTFGFEFGEGDTAGGKIFFLLEIKRVTWFAELDFCIPFLISRVSQQLTFFQIISTVLQIRCPFLRLFLYLIDIILSSLSALSLPLSVLLLRLDPIPVLPDY